MAAMTTVFRVKDPSVLERFEAGDKVRFSAERAEGAIVVTQIEAAQ
jgi:Cu/Ag efflux protein CusF